MMRVRLSLSLVALASATIGLAWPVRAQDGLAHGAAQIPVPLVDVSDTEALQEATDRLMERLLHGARRGSVRPARADEASGALLVDPVALSRLRPVLAHGLSPGAPLRLDGERGARDFEFHVPDGDQVQAFRLATQSSINLLPERSHFRVFLNGTELGGGPLRHFAGPGVDDLPVPPGLVVTGVNRVRIEIVHFHRIFCGPDAAFSLWTEIDLGRSGAVLSGAMIEPSAATFLMGLAATAAAGAPLEIRGAEYLGHDQTRWLAALTQRVANVMGGDPIPFRLSGAWTLADAVPAGARVTLQPADEPGLRFARGGDGAQVMLLGLPPADAMATLALLDEALPHRDRSGGLAMLEPRRHVPLSELGFRDTEFHDRYARSELRFRLPDDYVVMTNLKSFLHLTYVYADALPPESMLQIHVNGTNIRLLPLRGEAGQLIEAFPIRFEARYLRAGENTLTFEMFIPGDPPDLPCPLRPGAVVAISDQSTLIVPYSPSMFLADMHHAFASLGPESVEVGDLTAQAFDETEVLALRAALTLDRQPGSLGGPARLHLIPSDELAGVPTGDYFLSRRTLEGVLDRPPQAESEPVLAGLSGAFPMQTRREAQPGMLTVGWDWLARSFDSAMDWLHPRPGTALEDWLSRQSGQAVLLQLDPVYPAHLWLLRAPDADVNAISAAIARARAQGGGPRGQVSVLDHDGRWQNWYAPDRQPFLLERLSAGNIRHVMGNFVSATPVRFVTILFLLALISAVFALRLVIATREHKP